MVEVTDGNNGELAAGIAVAATMYLFVCKRGRDGKILRDHGQDDSVTVGGTGNLAH